MVGCFGDDDDDGGENECYADGEAEGEGFAEDGDADDDGCDGFERTEDR